MIRRDSAKLAPLDSRDSQLDQPRRAAAAQQRHRRQSVATRRCQQGCAPLADSDHGAAAGQGRAWEAATAAVRAAACTTPTTLRL